ncbi:htrA-like peptidase. Serine peptidase. MEROPS family S01B [Oceanobacillus limi]|uniref:HtrA-like peptidase. Serine peptidase. MEROPS family S01B n=1 Tax=Oceanobacillus limi TaxID=930131 RepID=A0A1I0AT49_9BACI|nr:trypsin-like peptidase domain-containing protein [Oceanobacillus limi]SES97364.1 htrA-like peptidase. Serine peptidase. MEROPS family S01B [Oceanobacillus limi]
MEHNSNNFSNENQINEDKEKTEDLGLTKASPQSNDSNKSKSKLSGLLSGIFGGIISAVIVTLLFTNNIIPIQNEETGTAEAQATEDQNNAEFVTTMSVDNDEISASNLEEVSEAVVGVLNLRRQSIWTTSEEAGAGSGIIYKKENGKAYIVTNHHVVDGAEEVEIVLNNEERLDAKVLGSDELSDLAILQVDGSKINRVANLGASSDVKVGETVLAIGNPLGMEFANSLTKGIISGLDRSVSVDTNGDGVADWITEVIQTDAAINPGNSGGALVDTDGNVIGINSMKVARSEVEGIGFAIPIDSALPIMEQLETDGEVSRPFIGISTAPINQVPPQYQNNVAVPDDVEGGMVIADVEAGSPADEAGLQQFDVITKINGENVTSILELRKYMYSETKVGDSVTLEIYRNGDKQEIELNLSKRNSI